MDANTVVVARVLIAAVFGVGVVGILIWGLTKIHAQGQATIDAAMQWSEQPTWMYRHSTSWGDDDDDDEEDWLYDEDEDGEPVWTWEKERRELRDRLAATLWELRQVKRKARVDDQVAWRLNDLETKIRSWEGGK